MVKFDDGTTDFHTPMDIPPPDTMNTEALDTPTDKFLNGLMTRYTLQSDVRKGDEIVHYLDEQAKAALQQYVDSECLKARREALQPIKEWADNYNSSKTFASLAALVYHEEQKLLQMLNTGGNKGE